MDKLHLCFYELSEQTQKELKEALFNHWKINFYFDKVDKKPDSIKEEIIQEEIDKLFLFNNAGIDVDAYPYLLR